MKESSSTSVFNSESGFTLIEILIAISLLALITIGVVTIVQNASNTMERTTEINKNNLQIETALARFEWDFSQIYSPMYFSAPLNMAMGDQFGNNAGASNDANQDGKDDTTGKPVAQGAAVTPELQEYYQRLMMRFEQNQHFAAVSKEGLPIPRFYSPEKNIFEFFTSSNRRKMENTKQSNFAWVRYALGAPIERKDDDNKEKSPNVPPSLKTLVRYFSADNPYGDKRLDPEDTNHVKGAVLLEDVESLEFQFWNMQSRKWETNLRTVPGGENALRGVKLMVTWYDSAGNKRSATRIYRNLWPMEVPVDSAAQTGNPGGQDTKNNTNNNNQGGDDED